MNDKDINDWIENENLSQKEIANLLNKLCSLGTQSEVAVTEKVVIFLKSKSQLEHVSREEVANYLHMSSRTLSRKLKNEDTGFHKLLDEERQRRCLQYLRCNMVCGQELAELLGLSDISHFYRSFKQWTGHSFSEAKSLLAENHGNIGTIFHRHIGNLDG